MYPFQSFPPLSPTRRRLVQSAAAALCLTALTVPVRPAAAFLQTTELRGLLGSDIGGVWLVIHHVMPEFRIRYDRPEGVSSPSDYVPFKVGPIDSEIQEAFGDSLEGVQVTEITDARVARETGIFLGDIILRFNSVIVTDQEDFQKGLEKAPKAIVLNVRRRGLMHSAARLMKLKYEAVEAAESDSAGAGIAVPEEKLNVLVLDVALPFDDAVQKARSETSLWVPTPEDLKLVGETWADLPEVENLRYMRSENKVVAAANYDSDLALDRNLLGSSFAMIFKFAGLSAGGQPGGQLIDLYGIKRILPDRMEGNVVSALVASAPFPISVEFKGAARFYRVADYSDADIRKRQKAASGDGANGGDFEGVELEPDIPADLK
jgi:hypothetical protein